MALANLLGATVDCRPHEVRPVALMFAHSALLGLTWVLYETVSDTLFLNQYGADKLPLVYTAAPFVSAAGALVYTRLEARLSLGTLFFGVVCTLLSTLILLRAGLALPQAGPAVIAMRVGFEMMYLLADLEYWSLAGQLFDLRQGKRLYGLIGSGEVLAATLGGFSVPLLTRFLHLHDLLLICIGAMGLCLVVLARILRGRPHAAAGHAAADEPDQGERLSPRALVKNRYLVLILAVYGLFILAYYFLDFTFYDEVEARYPEEERLAGFIGTFRAAAGLVHLFIQAVVFSWLVNRFGVRGGLLGLPVVLAVGGGLLALLGMTGRGLAAVFGIVVVTKLLGEVLGRALQEPSVRILYQLLPSGQRMALQAMVEGIFGAGVAGLAGLLLLVATGVFHFGAVQVSYVLVLLAAAWIVITLELYRTYAQVLRRCLAGRRLAGQALSLRDSTSRHILQGWLASPQAVEVLYALHVMEEEDDAALQAILINLLDHPAPQVRREALARIERQKVVAARDRVAELVRQEASPAVQGEALRVLVALGEGSRFDEVIPFLRDPRPELRKGAIVGLLRHGGIEGVLTAGMDLMELARSAEPADRTLAAEVLGEVGIPAFHRPLLPLLEDADPGVRRGALRAAAQIASPALCPAVLPSLAVPSLRSPALAALAAVGPPALPILDAAIDRAPGSGPERLLLLRVTRRIGGAEAVELLRQRLDDPDGEIHREVLLSLFYLGYAAEGPDRAAVLALISQECGRAAWLVMAQDDLDDEAVDPALRRALAVEYKHTVDNLLLLLSFLYPAQGLGDARIHLDDDAPQQRALALEIIDQLLSRELKPLVIPLVEDLPRPLRLQRLRALAPQVSLRPEQRLPLLEEAGWLSAWTRACLLYHVGLARAEALRAVVARGRSHRNGLVRETATWAHARLAGEAPCS
jgi:ATP:ADP antiporter, AAA family